MSLVEAARIAATKREREAVGQPVKPTELQCTAAHSLERTISRVIDPLAVRELDIAGPYDEVETVVEGVQFKGSFKWMGRNQRYKLCGFWKVEITRRTLFRTRSRWVAIASLADLGDALLATLGETL
jgi:hypothetical protein